jgi:toxin ParE1/3/4
MNHFRILESAIFDLVDIDDYFMENASGEMAMRVQRGLIAAFGSIGRNPGLGHRRSDISRRALFFLAKPPHFIIYRKASDHVEIVAVLHGSRNIKKILRDRTS